MSKRVKAPVLSSTATSAVSAVDAAILKAAEADAAAAGADGVSPVTFSASATKAEFAPPVLEKRSAEIDAPTAKIRMILLSINACVIFIGLGWLVPAAHGPTSTLVHVLTPIVLLPILDLFIAFVHMTLDNPALLQHSVLGGMAFDFQEHHVEPWKCAAWPAWYQVTEAVPGSLFFSLYALPFQYFTGHSMMPFAFWTALLSILNQYTHRFCHMSPSLRPGWMKALAACGLVNKPETHALHHQTLDQSYAILNGISNPVVDALTRYWRHALHPGWVQYTIIYGLTIPWLYAAIVLRIAAPAITTLLATGAGAYLAPTLTGASL